LDLRIGATHKYSIGGEEKARGNLMEAKVQDKMVKRGGKEHQILP